MPYIGHREPDLSNLGVSPVGTAPRAASTPLVDRVTRLVERVARDAADRQLLLEALGLTSREAAEAVPVAS